MLLNKLEFILGLRKFGSGGFVDIRVVDNKGACETNDDQGDIWLSIIDSTFDFGGVPLT